MKNPSFLIVLLLILAPIFSDAQITVAKEKTANPAAMQHDTAYKRIQAELATIMKTAKGKKTNYAAVKNLFLRNKSAVAGLEMRYNLQSTRIINQNNNQYITNTDRPLARLAKTVPIASAMRIYTGPFFYASLLTNNSVVWESSSTGNKWIWNTPDNFGDRRKLGWSAFYYQQYIEVPDEPAIVGVRLEFEYSFYTTGWESGGTQFSTVLGFWADNKFTSPAYNSMNATTILASEPHNQRYKRVTPLFTGTFQGANDFTFTKDSTFAIEGYVTPGQTFVVKLMAGYEDGSMAGPMGAYHYGEFELKKIVVHFLRADQ